MTLAERREQAVANFKAAAFELQNMTANKERRTVALGQAFTDEEVLAEMQKEPPTPLGLSLIEVWNPTKQEVDAKIAKLAASR